MKKLLIILFSLFLFSCNKESKELVLSNNELSKILESFAKEMKCKDCIYEMYIDKTDPHNYTIMLYSGKSSLVSEENEDNKQVAVNSMLTSSGVEFIIYTGIEHYFSYESSKKSKDNNKEIYKGDNKIWVIKDSFGKLTVTKRQFVYPFMPLPIYPDSKIEDKFKNK